MTGSSKISAETTWVLVCTYQRNDLLQPLLNSLRQVSMPAESPRAHPRLLVVDNAPQPEARDLVARMYPEAVYVHQPSPGIATARNTSVESLPEEAQAVIFVDDDEQVTPEWFTALLDCAVSSGADAVSGPVHPVFESGEPPWAADYGYVRRTDFPTGPHQRRLATNNTLVRAEWFTRHGLRFDQSFNFSGGSDSDLFERMLGQGAQFWWCAEATVTEHVPPHRATQQWLRQRAVRGGRVRALKLRRARGGAAAFTRIAAEGAARLGYGALRRTGQRLRGRAITYTSDYYLCEGLGMLQSLTGQGRDEYARET